MPHQGVRKPPPEPRHQITDKIIAEVEAGRVVLLAGELGLRRGFSGTVSHSTGLFDVDERIIFDFATSICRLAAATSVCSARR
jgi:hypothetical protein